MIENKDPSGHRINMDVCAKRCIIIHNPGQRAKNTGSISHIEILNRTPSIDSLSLNFEVKANRIKLMKHNMRLPGIITCIQGLSKFCPEFDSNHKKTGPQNMGSLSAVVHMEPSKP
jgi:hypothetical protein